MSKPNLATSLVVGTHVAIYGGVLAWLIIAIVRAVKKDDEAVVPPPDSPIYSQD
jgi:hypothetical protein